MVLPSNILINLALLSSLIKFASFSVFFLVFLDPTYISVLGLSSKYTEDTAYRSIANGHIYHSCS
jgi:hypothetical protein